MSLTVHILFVQVLGVCAPFSQVYHCYVLLVIGNKSVIQSSIVMMMLCSVGYW